MTQTAVQWLLDNDCYKWSTKWPDIIEQALEMEKQHHGQTWDDAITAFKGRGFVESRALCDFDEYYEATYGRHSE
jgi:hypothetical protein